MILFSRIIVVLLICSSTVKLISQCQIIHEIAYLDGTDFIEFCNENESKCIAAEPLRPPGMSYAFSLTDGEGIILSTSYANNICLDQFGPGNYRMYGIAFQGLLLRSIGESIEEAQLGGFCHSLSTNFLQAKVVRLESGQVQSSDMRSEFCIASGVAEVVQFVTNVEISESYKILVVDNNDIIIDILEVGEDFDVSTVGVGEYAFYGLAYSGSLLLAVGDSVDKSPASDGCFSLTEEGSPFKVVAVDGGRVLNDGVDDVVYACPMNGVDDIVIFSNTSTSTEKYQYIVTDDAGVIIGLPQGTGLNFDNSEPGICFIYGVSYTGTFLGGLGDQVEDFAFSDGCFDVSDNVITIYREDPEAGSIETDLGTTAVYTCPNDTLPDIVKYSLVSPTHSKIVYAITNDEGIVLALTTEQEFDFLNAGEGVCRIYGIAYTGELLLAAGDSISTESLSDDCYDLSENYIEVIRAEPQPHRVELIDSSTAIRLCVGDDDPDSLIFRNGASGLAQFTYIITSDDNTVLAITEDEVVDFEGAGNGVCRIWGLSFTGTLAVEVGDNLDDGGLADNCFFLSENYIEVSRILIDAGTVMTLDMETEISTCPGDGEADVISYTNGVTTSADVLYVITNAQDTVLAIVSQQEFDFELAGEGTCRIWAVAFTGDFLLTQGSNISLDAVSDDCYDVSDGFVTVNRFVPSAGSITTDNFASDVSLCLGDGQDHIVSYQVSSKSNAPFTYVITDDQDSILAITQDSFIDFDQANLGTCRIYGLSYVGELLLGIGSYVGDQASEQCFAYAEGAIEVTREEVLPTTVTSSNGETRLDLCPGDGTDDNVQFINDQDSEDGYRYIITNDQDEVIFLPNDDDFNFENVLQGICRVYGVSFTGEFILRPGNELEFFPISDRCYQLSSNFIEIRKLPPNWDAFSTTAGDIEVEILVGDGQADVIEFSDEGRTAGLGAIVVTDISGVIIGKTDGRSIDFEGAGEGLCIAYGLSYTGTLTADEGNNINDGALSDDCFELSDNPVSVNRIAAIMGPDPSHLAKFSYSLSDQRLVIYDLVSTQYHMALYDMMGQLSMEKIVKGPLSEISFQLGELRPGSYVVVLRDMDQRSIQSHRIVMVR